MLLLIIFLEREEGGEKETSMWERNIDQLPPANALAWDQTHNRGMCPNQTWNWTAKLLVYGMMFQPTLQPGQGKNTVLKPEPTVTYGF